VAQVNRRGDHDEKSDPRATKPPERGQGVHVQAGAGYLKLQQTDGKRGSRVLKSLGCAGPESTGRRSLPAVGRQREEKERVDSENLALDERVHFRADFDLSRV